MRNLRVEFLLVSIVVSFFGYGLNSYALEKAISSTSSPNSTNINAAENIFLTTFVTPLIGPGKLNKDGLNFIVVKKKIPVDWDVMTLKTENTNSFRITDFNSGLWSLLPSSELDVLDTKENLIENPFERTVSLKIGTIRYKSLKLWDGSSPKLDHIVQLETNELKVIGVKAADIILTREKDPKSQKFVTKVYSLNGQILVTAKIKINSENETSNLQKVKLIPGIIYSLSEDGRIDSFKNPTDSEIENVIAYTTTFKELEARKHYSDGFSLEDLIHKTNLLDQNSEYFEILNLFYSSKNLFKNTPELRFILAKAEDNLNYSQEAIVDYQETIKLDPNNIDAHWRLAKLYIKIKNYDKAQQELEIVRNHKNFDAQQNKNYEEYDFYIGVVYFNQKNLLKSKEKFTACLWNSNLSPELRKLSADYLSKIKISKPWSVVIPIGLSYDSNVLSLTNNQSLPSEYSKKSVFKSYLGDIFTYDPALSSEESGWFFGGNQKLFSLLNLEKSYSHLNALVLEASGLETKRYKKNDDVDYFQLYQTLGMVIVDNYQSSRYFLTGIKWHDFDFNLGYQNEFISDVPGEKVSEFLLNQFYSNNLFEKDNFSLGINGQLQEKLTGTKSYSTGSALNLILNPALTYVYNLKINFVFSHEFNFLWTAANESLAEYKFIPMLRMNTNINKNWFVSLSASYEMNLIKLNSEVVHRPEFTVLLIGTI